MTLVLEIAAGVVLGLVAFSVLKLIFAWILSRMSRMWEEMQSHPWISLTFGIIATCLLAYWYFEKK